MNGCEKKNGEREKNEENRTINFNRKIYKTKLFILISIGAGFAISLKFILLFFFDPSNEIFTLFCCGQCACSVSKFY